jgi:hypothetical protein
MPSSRRVPQRSNFLSVKEAIVRGFFWPVDTEFTRRVRNKNTVVRGGECLAAT